LYTSKKTAESGFTLVELIMIMVIVSILGVSATSMWPGNTMELHSLLYQLKQDIRWMQSVCLANSGVALPGTPKPISPPCTIRSVGNNQYEFVDVLNQPAKSLVMLDSGFTVSSFSITFDARGNPGVNNQSVTISKDGTSRSLTIFGTTGLVR